uniref:Methyltransferase type 11 domain-containing protein n=1 Tax=Chromera velia CCMP2878 TaxID=1169474 RepID=A0A0G4H8F5_9ALVE|mmetsp:Transcript_48174/g.95075  ORF Transcript_48174/g.95075 Transcript_48174/m.95075 type:complete len:287 (+) Transcript_48174:122-982(+)|eukprot:Cvel_25139.t1-p1 / transcript=Cvel_25139.t1 / gene=Cvel_25139 / organism=Chromera_velia_CCMP2878 / gene_product=hypothetical protein / transcript_product=hypothetical protein / location=Cvel_scaffold2810:12982-13839(+) / protein_length=286 / sequence_SO=supercontig / SO=protein_coding / is_pseudo=false
MGKKGQTPFPWNLPFWKVACIITCAFALVAVVSFRIGRAPRRAEGQDGVSAEALVRAEKILKLKHEVDFVFQRAADQYSVEYFAWQSTNVELGGKITALLFSPYLKPSDTVVDFGCGSGTVLETLDVKTRWCVEVNDVARGFAAQRGKMDRLHKFLSEIPDESVDKVMSNHALEHVAFPPLTLLEIFQKLKPGGRLIIAVPSMKDEGDRDYDPKDVNHHLYAWNCQLLGNLVKVVGFDLIEAKTKRFSRTGASDEAFLRGGADEFWKVAQEENVHPQTFVVAQKPG